MVAPVTTTVSTVVILIMVVGPTVSVLMAMHTVKRTVLVTIDTLVG